MRAIPSGVPTIHVAIALLLALSLVGAVVSAGRPILSAHAAAKDDDKDESEGGDVDEADDSNRGNGNDADGVDEDNPGKGKGKDKDKDKEDDEEALVTAIPTATSQPQLQPTDEATHVVLTPATSPTGAASTPTTGALLISLRTCPDGTDPAVGTTELARTCIAGRPDARFELGGRSGVYSGWRRDVTTDEDGDARIVKLAEGTYSLTLEEFDWCAAEASAVDDGLIVINPGETTEVTAYLCDVAPGTPASR